MSVWVSEVEYRGWPAVYAASAVRYEPCPGIREERIEVLVIGRGRATRKAERLAAEGGR